MLRQAIAMLGTRMPDWLKFIYRPEFAVLTTLALPLALATWGVWRRIRNGADQLTPSLHFLLGLGATLAAAVMRPVLFIQGFDQPLIDIPLIVCVLYTLWMAPKAARTWYKKPEAKRRKKLELPEISFERGLPGLSAPGMSRPEFPGGDGSGEEARPKLQRVRAGRLDFRVMAGMAACVPVGLFLGYLWLAEIVDLYVGFTLLVLCAAAFVFLSRRIYRDTFLVEEDGGDDGGDGFGFELPEGAKAPIPAPLPRPVLKPQPVAKAAQPARFGKRRA
jgi:uncharacterized membrane protein YfcA